MMLFLVRSSFSGQLTEYDISTGTPVFSAALSGRLVAMLLLRDTPHTVMLAFADGAISCWNTGQRLHRKLWVQVNTDVLLDSDEVVRAFRAHTLRLYALADMGGDGFVSASADCTAVVWRAASSSPVSVLRGVLMSSKMPLQTKAHLTTHACFAQGTRTT